MDFRRSIYSLIDLILSLCLISLGVNVCVRSFHQRCGGGRGRRARPAGAGSGRDRRRQGSRRVAAATARATRLGGSAAARARRRARCASDGRGVRRPGHRISRMRLRSPPRLPPPDRRASRARGSGRLFPSQTIRKLRKTRLEMLSIAPQAGL